MDIGIQMVRLRKSKGLSQQELAKAVDTSREMIGKYEREEVVPSVEMAKKIAEALEVTLDFLVDQDSLAAVDKNTLKRMKELGQLPEEDKEHIFYTLDNLIKAAKFKAIQ
jgi:transcriptional regulator with XRE-family HTH domain